MTHNPVSSSLLHGKLSARFEWLRGALGGLVGLGLAAAVSHWLIGDNAALPWLIAPMGASTVLLFAIPASPFAQPWPVLGGHLVAGAIALLLAGQIADPALAVGIAVAAAIAGMSLLGCLH
ncbi:MAG: HPP family protein, partial [Sphingomonadaceae bacterium]|nr:HPP family protein [Sphingomonadaceae bacterium]